MYRMRLAGTTILYSKGPEAKGAKELEIRYKKGSIVSILSMISWVAVENVYRGEIN